MQSLQESHQIHLIFLSEWLCNLWPHLRYFYFYFSSLHALSSLFRCNSVRYNYLYLLGEVSVYWLNVANVTHYIKSFSVWEMRYWIWKYLCIITFLRDLSNFEVLDVSSLRASERKLDVCMYISWSGPWPSSKFTSKDLEKNTIDLFFCNSGSPSPCVPNRSNESPPLNSSGNSLPSLALSAPYSFTPFCFLVCLGA